LRDYSVPALVDIPPAASLADVIFQRAEEHPHQVILRQRPDGRSWQDVTATEFATEVSRVAKGLVAAGIGAGDRVGLLSRTRYEWTLIDYAIWAAGAVTVPVYETSSAEQVEWILSDSGARGVFAETARHAGLIAGVGDRLPELGHLWLIEDGEPGDAAGPSGWQLSSLAELSGSGDAVSDEDLRQRRAGQRSDEVATIIYTSGTTGRPKGCEITHANLLSNSRNAIGSMPELFEQPGAATLLFMPLAHSFARIIEVGCLESGTVMGHWPDTGTLAEGLREFRPTFLLAVPRVFEKVFNTAQQQAAQSKAKARIFAAATQTAIDWSKAAGGHPAGPGLRARHALFDRLVYAKLRAAVGGQVQYAVSGGAALGERLGHFFRGVGITILEGYGMTESTAAATVNKPSRNEVGSVGLPLPGVTIRIAEDGEILLKGRNVFPRYWHNESASAEMLDADGWLRSGDLGALDNAGFLRVTGRKKELIVTAGGKNVAPAVLEDRLRAHPLVSQCMVVGDGKPFIGVLVTLDPDALGPWCEQHGKPAGSTAAALAGDPDVGQEIQAAVDEANQAVSQAESIRQFRILEVDFTEENGYLTPSLKVRRNVVAKDFAAEIEGIYTSPRR
jgi:long-chain acyl-CoA synthetase